VRVISPPGIEPNCPVPVVKFEKVAVIGEPPPVMPFTVPDKLKIPAVTSVTDVILDPKLTTSADPVPFQTALRVVGKKPWGTLMDREALDNASVTPAAGPAKAASGATTKRASRRRLIWYISFRMPQTGCPTERQSRDFFLQEPVRPTSNGDIYSIAHSDGGVTRAALRSRN
jgi:hypothetical protein